MNTLPVVLDLHAEEASFLAVLRDYALRAPHYDLDDLGKLEDRIDAHLDGLRIAGPAGLETLLAQLGPHTVGEVFAGVVLAFETHNTNGLAQLSEHVREAVETERGYLMALGWLDWEWVAPWIDRMLASPKPENLVDLIAKVKETGADVGLAFDGDGDRVGVVTNTGENVFADRLLMLFARDVVARNANAEIIFDVKCTRRLTPLIKEYGGRPLMWKTGHSLIKKKMKETGALLAGEMSGHVFFKERWFGFDDGIYSAARLLEILSKEKSTAQELFQTFPNDISTPEINIHVTEESKFSIIDALHDAQWGEGANLTSIDGVRVDYAKGWGLVRASNTTPVLVLRFEADTEAELQRIKDVFHAQLKRVAPDLQLPF